MEETGELQLSLTDADVRADENKMGLQYPITHRPQCRFRDTFNQRF